MKSIPICFAWLCLIVHTSAKLHDPTDLAPYESLKRGDEVKTPVGLDARFVIKRNRDLKHDVESGSHLRRELLQTQTRSGRRNCDLSQALQERFYNASTQTWTLNPELLEELEDDVQLLIDCVGNSETVHLASGTVVKSSTVVTIERPISIVGNDSEGPSPRWTCGSSDEGNQIMVIRDVDDVTVSGIQFVECDAPAKQSPIFVERSAVSFLNCEFENNHGINGGVISAHSSTLTLDRSTFRSNRAEMDGGSIFADDGSTVAVSSCLFEENTSGRQGGSIRLFNGTSATFINSSFTRNKAESGGAIHATSFEEFAQIEIEGCHFHGNQATTNGGAISLEASEHEEGHSDHAVITVHGEERHAEEIVNQARRNIGSPITSDSEDLTQLLTMTVKDSVFEFNEAGEMGGAIAVLVGSLLWVEHSIFGYNTAGTSSGAAHILRSLFFCDYCLFNSNTAGASGGALMIDGIAEAHNHGSHICEGALRHTSFVNNTCSNRGGGVLVDGLESYFYAVENTTYQSNTARAGGAFAVGNAAFVNITSASFLQNRAMDGGGALSLSFLQFRDTRCVISNVMFAENNAATGGAVFAEFYLYVDNKMEQTHFGDQSLENPSIQMNHTVFLGNSAVTGGAMELNGVPALLRNISMENNRAKDAGGALALVGLSVVQVIGGTFHRNKAKSGGALMVRERCMMHCIGCAITNNKATADGGGVCIVCLFVKKQAVVFECDECAVKENRARIGGGLHLNHKSVPYRSNFKNSPIIVLKNLDLMDNYARIGGGGIMASHPAHVAVQCSGRVEAPTSKNLADGLLKINDVHQMSRLSQKACPAWKGNSVGEGGYGPTRATFAFTANVCLANDKECFDANGEIPVHSSAGLIPPIKITLVDQYGQSPAEPPPCSDHFFVAPQSKDVRLSGQLESHFFRGEASLTETTVTGNPGDYSLTLHFSDKRMADINLYTELRSCAIGEQSVLHNTACQKCEAGTYSVQEPLEKCTECHGSAICRKWGIAPKNGHWIPSPCVTQARECLSENACTYDGREEAMDDFFDTHEPTCDLSDENTTIFHSKQCSEGHEGLLCGSCSDGYGGGLECYRCMGKLTVLALLLLNLLWFFVLAAIAIRGNLSHSKPQTELSRLRFEDNDAEQSIVEMYLSGIVPKRTSSRRLNNLSRSSWASSQRFNSISSKSMAPPTTTMSECEAAKKNAAERFKLFVNFAQVNSMALIITTDWTKAAEEMLTVLDFTGAVSAEAAITLDCLFSGSCSVPRSVSKTIMSLVLPLVLLSILALFWTVKHLCNLQLLKRRLTLSLLIVLYISYIGIARRAFSVLYCVRIPDGSTLEDSTNKLYWSQDTSVVCYEGSHLVLLGSLALPMIFLVLLAFPIASAMFLFVARKNQALDTIELKETFGFMFQAYKEEYVYWDVTILFRKAALALVVIFGATLGGNMQGTIAVSILAFSFYMHMNFLPYNETFDSLNTSEKYSLSVSLITYISGVFCGNSSTTPEGRVFCSIVVLIFNLGFVVYSVKDIYLSALRYMRLQLEEHNFPNLNKEEVHFKLVAMWLRHQCSEILTACKCQACQQRST